MEERGTREVNSVKDIRPGDCLYQEDRGKTYWVKDISSKEVVLVDVQDRGESWIKETLDRSFAAKRWVRQASGPQHDTSP